MYMNTFKNKTVVITGHTGFKGSIAIKEKLSIFN